MLCKTINTFIFGWSNIWNEMLLLYFSETHFMGFLCVIVMNNTTIINVKEKMYFNFFLFFFKFYLYCFLCPPPYNLRGGGVLNYSYSIFMYWNLSLAFMIWILSITISKHDYTLSFLKHDIMPIFDFKIILNIDM